MKYKLCARCGAVVPHPIRYCESCAKAVRVEIEKVQKQRASQYNKTRDPKYKQFYNSKEWIMLKEKILLDNQYQCKDCQKELEEGIIKIHEVQIADEVHHEEPIQTKEGWEKRLQYSGVTPLCRRHHNKRHNRFGKGKGGSRYAY